MSSNVLLSQAGARVQQVVDALAPHGLTLQNYASISEQQLGGFLQVLIVPYRFLVCDVYVVCWRCILSNAYEVTHFQGLAMGIWR